MPCTPIGSSASKHLLRKAAAWLFALTVLGAHQVATAQTTFGTPSTFANGATGSVSTSPGGVAAAGGSSIFLHSGTPSNGITPVTFGQSFTVSTNATTDAGTGAWAYQGAIGGNAIGAGTTAPISYNFTITNNGYIDSAVDWTLYFRGGTNTETLVASGTLAYSSVLGTASSATFSGNASSYNFATSASSSDTYRAYVGISFASNAGAMNQGIITVTMNNTGYLGQGITLNASAVPEPSTYAAILGGMALIGTIVVRQRRNRRF